MVEQLTITRLGNRGDGFADTPQGTVYVPYTLPGEVVAAEPVAGHPDRAQLVSVEKPSPERVTPISPHFGVCGGCALQHWALAPQLAWKRQKIVDALAHEHIEAVVAAIVDAHGAGRRRITLHARRANGVLRVGFAAARAHTIVAIDRCPILAPAMDGCIPAAWAIAEAIQGSKPLDIQVTATNNGLDIDVRGCGAIDAATTARLAAIAAKHRLARLTRHGELIAQTAPPAITIGGATLILPPGAFLQATQAGEETLTQTVLAFADKAKAVADLFCGVGPFALRLARQARGTAIDSDRAAVAALEGAAKGTKGLKPVTAQTRDLFRNPLVASELKAFDAVVFDPPRQGAEAQARELAKSAVPLVIGVSCDPVTFARDAGILIAGGYALTRVVPVDQFRYSSHVELVAAFTRQR
ncbi:MAG: class I SAM-dependent RNA methyltransferase [Pseudolabrys sp.]|nr:class I SAM-dependent RNA methyltransferase [Pseudolabrys sp.]